ncbi:hypothetical protein [Leptospira mayottensis]|uniref:hypothetical protein n=1 Tax=Leptospira mayottensis TaxID=1137606 RepID=UPI0013C2FE06|nr:hypothetical protein [Leptospira mayottensis]
MEWNKVEGINKINEANLKLKEGPFTLYEINEDWKSKMNELKERYNMIHEDTIEGLKKRMNISGDVEIARLSGNTRVGDWVIGDKNATLNSALVSDFPNTTASGFSVQNNRNNKVFGLVLEKYENGLGAIQTRGSVGLYYSAFVSYSVPDKPMIYLSSKIIGKAVNDLEVDATGRFVEIGVIENSILKITRKIGHVGSKSYEF